MFSYKTEAKKKKQKTILFFSLAIFSLILIFFACLFTGQQKFSFQQILKAFYDKNSFEHTIIFSIRLPRLFLNIFAGALLAGSGAVFQNFFQREEMQRAGSCKTSDFFGQKYGCFASKVRMFASKKSDVFKSPYHLVGEQFRYSSKKVFEKKGH